MRLQVECTVWPPTAGSSHQLPSWSDWKQSCFCFRGRLRLKGSVRKKKEVQVSVFYSNLASFLQKPPQKHWSKRQIIFKYCDVGQGFILLSEVTIDLNALCGSMITSGCILFKLIDRWLEKWDRSNWKRRAGRKKGAIRDKERRRGKKGKKEESVYYQFMFSFLVFFKLCFCYFSCY